MIRKPSSRESFAVLFLSFVSLHAPAQSPAQPPVQRATQSSGPSPAIKSKGAPNNPHATPTSPMVYEDDEIKLPLPPGWLIATGDHPAPTNAEGSALSLANHKLALLKNGYTLALDYETEHASGIEGGRFLELFSIPWLEDSAVATSCSGYMRSIPQPASRTLILISLTVRTGDPNVREICAIQKNLGHWSNQEERYVGDERWFGAYFTTTSEGWFFPANGTGCREKSYTLTSQAKTIEELPSADDPALKKTIAEAIDIVDSIHYKRCPPSAAPQ